MTKKNIWRNRRFKNSPEEYLRFGFNQKENAFFLDRGNTNVKWVHDNPFFTDKLSMTVYGTETGETEWMYYRRI